VRGEIRVIEKERLMLEERRKRLKNQGRDLDIVDKVRLQKIKQKQKIKK
jgi:hypothetical protein